MTDDLRRADDDRYRDLSGKVDNVANDVKSIRDMLISEPEASPLGRSLLKTSSYNRRLIDEHWQDFQNFRKEEFDPIDDWWQQQRGAWRMVIGVGVVLGIVGSFFGILAYFQP
jgi:hypothetical protein